MVHGLKAVLGLQNPGRGGGNFLTFFAICSPPTFVQMVVSGQGLYYWSEAIRCDTRASAWQEENVVCTPTPKCLQTCPDQSIVSMAKKKDIITTAPRIPAWSPTVVLTWRHSG